MRATVVCCLVVLVAGTARGQSPGASASGGFTTVWSTNPLGFLQLGPNLEVEHATGGTGAFGAGFRLPTLGVMTHIINSGIESGWSAYGLYRFYPQGDALARWYVGPHLEFGGTANETFTSRIYGAAGEFGYRWIRPNHFSITVGGLLGILKSNDTWKDGTGSAGNETYLIWMLNVSLGVAR